MHEDRDCDRLHDFDRLIGAALSTYGDADAGLERRVLAHIAAAHSPAPRRGKIIWAAVLTAAAALLLLIVLVRVRPAHSPGTRAFNPHPTEQAPKAEARVEPRAGQRSNGTPHHGRRESTAGKPVAIDLPKEEMFPMPQPLSPAEHELAEFAAQAPKAERKSFIQAQEHLDEPIQTDSIRIAAIRIDAIRIPPLESPQSGSN